MTYVYRRQRVLLSLLEALDEPVGNTESQKPPLIIQEHEVTYSYEFIPNHPVIILNSPYKHTMHLTSEGIVKRS